jgi:hypothetical protein
MTAAFAFWAALSGIAVFVSGFIAAATRDPVFRSSEATLRFWPRALAVSLAAMFIFGGAAAALSDRTADRVGPCSPKTGSWK